MECSGNKQGCGKRDLYFDFLRGVAIFAVVLIHTFPQQSDDFEVFLRQLIGFAVPLFLAISGYFVSNKKFVDRKKFFTFLKKQILKIYIPVLVWSVPYFCMALKGGMNPLLCIMMLLICGFSIYYFVALIIQCYFLLPVINICKNKYWLCFFLGITLFTNTFFTYLMQIKGVKLPLIVYVGIFPSLIGFFALGAFLRKCGREYKIGILFLGAVIAWFLSYAEFKWLNSFIGGGLGTKPSNMLLCFFVVLILFSRQLQNKINLDNILSRVFLYMGKNSFGIYLTHCFFISLIKMDLWFIRALLVIFATMLFMNISKRLLPVRFNRLLGFF